MMKNTEHDRWAMDDCSHCSEAGPMEEYDRMGVGLGTLTFYTYESGNEYRDTRPCPYHLPANGGKPRNVDMED